MIHKGKGGEDWEVGQKKKKEQASEQAIHATSRQTDTTISRTGKQKRERERGRKY